MIKRRRFAALMLAGAVAPLGTLAPASDLPQLTVGVMLTGTARWEMEVIQQNGLDAKHGFELVLRDVVGKQAGHVSLMSGDTDVILSDFVWVASLRANGEAMQTVPHSLAVGGVMVPADSDIASVEDLKGKTIGIAGGPLDKSWIALQAYYGKLTGGEKLAEVVTAKFGAPPLINELLGNGDIDAALNFWHFNARAKAAGNTELVSVAHMMDEMGIDPKPPLLSWVFREETAEAKPEALTAFLRASFEAKQILKSDDAAWDAMREIMGAKDSQTLFETLRDDCRAGIVTSYDQSTVDAAAKAFALMAEYGGEDLVGASDTMDQGTFWSGFSY
ncbi:ABC transporter substrate-binding protein [Mesobacterium pallidum]|uniref:ABC transporter substrate-binding protein n=1 Tax=Mesobacterium pallidum TaxID=2872037 RepID=UPI001EE1B899|nr:ABC transporter substrate-binding protein [Mesobacterium pallidum]